MKYLLSKSLNYIREETIIVSQETFSGRRKWQPTPVFLPRESCVGGAWWAAVHRVAQSRTQLK